jgi:hypothetical protein
LVQNVCDRENDPRAADRPRKAEVGFMLMMRLSELSILTNCRRVKSFFGAAIVSGSCKNRNFGLPTFAASRQHRQRSMHLQKT